MYFVNIPAGNFMMGCSAGDAECNADEKPAHRVTITRSFESGKYQVTQAEYEAVTTINPSYSKGPNLPVEGVSWEDAQKFCAAMNRKGDGYRYRLPTEAEWECACRAGTVTSYGFGALLPPSHACFASQSPTRVGRFAPNAYGIFDMHGNVWEWCQDWFEKHLTDAVDPPGPPRGHNRALRGGGWDRGPWHCRSAYRHSPTPDYRGSYMGFRLARTLP